MGVGVLEVLIFFEEVGEAFEEVKALEFLFLVLLFFLFHFHSLSLSLSISLCKDQSLGYRP